MNKFSVFLGLLVISIVLFLVATFVPSLRLLGIASVVLFFGLLIWLLLAILLSGRKEAPSRPFSERILELGHLTLDAGSVIHTDDDRFERNVEVLENLHSGEYEVTLRVREYGGGEQEWVVLRVQCGDVADGAARMDHEVVTDTGVLALACASVKDWPDLVAACRDGFKRLMKGSDSAIIVDGPDQKPRILLLAPPDGEGSYSMAVKTVPGGSDLTLAFLQEDSQ